MFTQRLVGEWDEQLEIGTSWSEAAAQRHTSPSGPVGADQAMARDPDRHAVMRLELDSDDEALLRDVLDSAVRDLSPEIADTDNPAYRRMLRERRDHLASLLERLHD